MHHAGTKPGLQSVTHQLFRDRWFPIEAYGRFPASQIPLAKPSD